MGELGSLLTRAREARGLTLEDAERDTRISRRYLQALEAEQFEVIPAPVYARGFLRSYSQYLGIDPQEALAMFPREDDPEYQRAAEVNAPAPRASRESPVSPVSAARPTWRAPSPSQQQALPQIGEEAPPPQPERRPTPLGRTRPQPKAEQNHEPIIGIDIGLPSPANRIKTDPAAQTRSVVVAIAALGVILGAVLVAMLISNLGGSDPPPGTGADATRTPGNEASATTEPGAGSDVERGRVPTLFGLTEADARQKATAAGYQVTVSRLNDQTEKGMVFDQSPSAGITFPIGQTVNIVVSEGP